VVHGAGWALEMSKPVELALDAPVRRFRSYPEYKDSGGEWLGKVPAHWEIDRLKATVTGCQNGVWADEPDGLNDIICVRVADFDRVRLKVDLTEPTLRSVDRRVLPIRLLKKGDLLLEKSGGGEKQPVGAIVLYDQAEPAICSNFVARLEIAQGFDARYLTYLHFAAYSARLNTRSIKQNTGIQNLDSGSYLNERTPLPPLSDQRSITAFLDRETTQIDALIAKKERLIELLQEKRTALIGDAISQSAASTEVRLGHYVDLLPGFAFPSVDFSQDPDDIRLLRGVNISPGSLRWDEVVNWPKHDLVRFGRYQLQLGDLVLGMDRPWIGSGIRVSFLTARDLPALLLQRVARLRAKHGLVQQYLRLILESPQFRSYFEPILTGISVPHISPDQIASFRFKLPSMSTQAAICQKLETEMTEIKNLGEHLETSVNHLKELRTALISAAVTGKIDVRGEAP